MKVTHIIGGLGVGGANVMLYKLVSLMDREAFKTEVFTLTGIGPIGERVRALGIPVRNLGMRRRAPNPFALLQLAFWLRQNPPDVVQTWGYHSDLIGGLASRLAGSAKVMWGIRHTDLDPHIEKRRTIWTAKACARLSPWVPSQIVCCARSSRRVHMKMGYESSKMVVIPNGFDLTAFKPDPTARLSVRSELGISEAAPLIGLVARYHPQKDHRNFIQAAERFNKYEPDAHFILCGEGISWTNIELAAWIKATGISRNFHLLGVREDVPRLTAALDIATVSAASGEAFPNVIGEAMACGVPCVVTDVGDSALIVGETGLVVPAKNSSALQAGWVELLLGMNRDQRIQLGLKARGRILETFSLSTIVEKYEQLYKSSTKQESHLNAIRA